MITQFKSKHESTCEIQDSINYRISDRNRPSKPLQPYLDVRPVMTKYSILPIVDPRAKINTPMVQMPVYSPEKVFNPGSTEGPWSGYASSINKESELRNQIYALQSCTQATYIPSSKSDLYEPYIYANPTDIPYFKGLFQVEKFEKFNPNTENIANDLFNNCTRQDIRNLKMPNCK
jgi:hypothetical protein